VLVERIEADGRDQERTGRLSLVRAPGGHREPSRAPKLTGEEVAFKTAELAVLEGKWDRLGPEESGLQAKHLAAPSHPRRGGTDGSGALAASTASKPGSAEQIIL